MAHLDALLTFIVGFLASTTRSVTAVPCEVSLPQETSEICKAMRDKELAGKQATFTYKFDASVHGFALLNMTPNELAVVLTQDPFSRYCFNGYLTSVFTSNASLYQYLSITGGKEITNISEYLLLSASFQSFMEPAIGRYARLPSRYEAFIRNKPLWISDKYFTQQRLAGNNPMSIRQVTIHGGCSVKTTKGKWCHFPFTYRGKVYSSCTTDGHYRLWCSTTDNYDQRGFWGNCAAMSTKEAEGCSVKTTGGEWCHFPFTYRGKVYSSCTTDGHYKLWCSTTDNYDQHGFWGNCAAKIIEEKIEGLDWNELNATLNPTFDWETAVQTALRTDDSLEDAIKKGFIFALRYELCDDLPRSPDLTDRDPRRTMRDSQSPIALFASAKIKGTDRNELVPVAIQMDYKPDSVVFTPSDGDNWMLAKLNVQVTDLGYSQMVEHLAKVHYLMEPFCVSLKRTLAALHPLNQMLKYHCRGIVIPNTFGTPRLMDDQGFMDLLFAFGNEGALRLLRGGHQYATWEATDLRAQIKKRGLADKKLVPYFPYRDDIEQILQVIEKVAESYVNLYYDNDRDVQEDSELQAYANELSVNGTGPNGGIGRIQGFPAKIGSKKDLVDIVARIISQVTIQHVAVNYELADYAVYEPNLPSKLYNDTRVKNGEFSVYRLPNRLTSAIGASFANGLASFRFDSLFDYGNELRDIKAVNIINRHYEDLMLRVQTHMQQTNEEREKIGDLTYPYLIPRWIPNGVQN
ncbi:polyunsaturated fatty acid 5-lipoxygenase-like isoform X1 [Montipora foliosa]|uniref:polyunsaturated fatty acid 5-lipoxygenase-like isoform X1 n=1 Tax=Montipora foliosa TaxID=591990 RepID=UPI0035F1305D